MYRCMNLKTGDILLFSERPSNCCMGCLDCVIKKCTCSMYSHAALVVVDPPWCTELHGVFVWESSWHGQPDPQDGIVKFGVQLTPLEFYTHQYPGRVRMWVRRATAFSKDAATLRAVHDSVYKKMYDTSPWDWIAAALRVKIRNRTDAFTCSAFVSYALTQFGCLEKDTCWTVVSAADLSSHRRSSLVHFTTAYTEDEYLGDFPQGDSELISNDMLVHK